MVHLHFIQLVIKFLRIIGSLTLAECSLEEGSVPDRRFVRRIAHVDTLILPWAWEQGVVEGIGVGYTFVVETQENSGSLGQLVRNFDHRVFHHKTQLDQQGMVSIRRRLAPDLGGSLDRSLDS